VVDPDKATPAQQAQAQAQAGAPPQVQVKKGEVVLLSQAASLNDVVKALNSVGATPQDLLAILQAMKASGALRAELEII
jgi:flagellar P-ring protein precursor FlgI